MANEKPVKEIKYSGIQLSFWQKKTEGGKRFFSLSLSKNYKDKEGNWKNADSFSEYDLPALKAVIDRAMNELIEVKEVK